MRRGRRRRARRRRVPVRHPGVGRRDADPERRRLRPGGRGRRSRRCACSTAATARSATSPPGECGFGYRTSVFKHRDRRTSCSRVTLRCSADAGARRADALRRAGARRSASSAGERAPLAADARRGARAAPRQGHGARPRRPRHVERRVVLHQPGARRGRRRRAAAPRRRAPGDEARPRVRRRRQAASRPPRHGSSSTPGSPRATGAARVGISTKHALALTNRGGGTTRELLGLAREIAAAVERDFGVALQPEPVLVGCAWAP